MKSINDLHFKQSKAHSDLNNEREFLSLWFEISGACHLNCSYCFAKPREEDGSIIRAPELRTGKATLKEHEYLRIIDEFSSLGGKYLGIPGKGEPFDQSNWPIVRSIIERASSLGIEITIFTTGDSIFFEGNSDVISFEKADFLADKKVVLLVKVNSLDESVQDNLVNRQHYTVRRNRALELLMSKYRFNQKGRLGIVTSIMKENKEEIPELYAYAKKNNLIFDCDTILQRGRGIDFYESDDITYTEVRSIFEELVRAGAIKNRPTGTYVGVACDRIKHHLYVDICGNVFPCIGCTDTIKDDLYLGNVRETRLAEIWNNPVRVALRERQEEIFEGVCVRCINFKNGECFSCLGRAVKSFEFHGESGNKIIVNTCGCVNHVPDIKEWFVVVDDYLRIALSDSTIRERFFEDWENLWLPNQNFAFSLLQLDPDRRNELISEVVTGLKDPHNPVTFRLDEIIGSKKLPVNRFSLKKHFSYSDLDFPLNKAWDFIYDPNRLSDHELPDHQREHLISSVSKSVLSNVFIPSIKIFMQEYRNSNSILLCNLMFYDNNRKRYFYRTFTDRELDYTVADGESANRHGKSLIMFRLAENFRDTNYFSQYMYDLSDEFRQDVYSDYELVLTPDDHDSFSGQSVIWKRSNFTLAVSELLKTEIVAHKVSALDAILNRLMPESETGFINGQVFRNITSDNSASENKIRDLFSSIIEEGFYRSNLELADHTDSLAELNIGLVRLIRENYINEKSNQLESLSCPFEFMKQSTEDVNLPLRKFISIFSPLGSDIGELIRRDRAGDIYKILNYLIFLGYLQKYLGINYYFIYHSTNFAYRNKQPDSQAPPSGILVCSRERLRKEAKTAVKLMISSLLKPFDEQYNIRSVQVRDIEIEKQANRSAVSSIMSRNMSHNLGSHVLSYVRNKIDTSFPNDSENMPFVRGVGKLLNYLQERQDFIAAISADFIPYTSTINFKDVIFDEINCDYKQDRHDGENPIENLLLMYIGRSEGISERDGIKVNFRNITGTRIERDLIFNSRADSEAVENYKELADFNFSIPSGQTGRQAIFSILENIIRNAAKHGKRKTNKLILTIDIMENEAFPDYYEVSVTDNSINGREACDYIHEKCLFDPFIDLGRGGRLKEENKGIKEMRICAAWLRNEKIYDMNERAIYSDNKSGQLKPPVLKVDTAGDALRYSFFLYKPKQVCFIIDEKANAAGIIEILRKNKALKDPVVTTASELARTTNRGFDIIVIDSRVEVEQSILPSRVIRADIEGGEFDLTTVSMSDLLYHWASLTFDSEITANSTIAVVEKNHNQIHPNLKRFTSRVNFTSDNFVTGENVIFRTHNDTIQDFLNFRELMEGKGLWKDIAFIEGISGNNSTNRLLRHDHIDDVWFLKVLTSCLTGVVIVDERLFEQMGGENEEYLRRTHDGLKLSTLRTLLDSGNFDEALTYFAGFKPEEELISGLKKVKVSQESYKSNLAVFFDRYRDQLQGLEARGPVPFFNDNDMVLRKKNIYVYNLIKSNNELLLFNLNNEPEARFKVGREGIDLIGGEAVNIPGQVHFVSIHQGILDKIADKQSFGGLSKELIGKGIISPIELFFKPRVRLLIHSGRSKPPYIPDNIPFVQYASLENSVKDCKFTLSELLYSSYVS